LATASAFVNPSRFYVKGEPAVDGPAGWTTGFAAAFILRRMVAAR
jgi:hypothetical protein